MAAEPNAVEQAVSRTLRDNMGRLQRTAEELNQAISDLVSACASSRATNAVPSMVRAQSAAASLSAAFEVLTRFVTASLQPSSRSPLEEEIVRLTSAVATESRPAPEPPEPQLPTPMGESAWTPPSMESSPPVELSPFEMPQPSDPPAGESVPVFVHEASTETEPAISAEHPVEMESLEPNAVFTLASLPADEHELHRRAYRLAKVSIQDIKLFR